MQPKTSNILIFGGGAVGGFVATTLCSVIPEKSVFVTCRSNYAQALKSGFILQSDVWQKTLSARPVIVRSAQEAAEASSRPFDFVVIATKSSHAVPTISEQILPAVSQSTTIVVIQNGIQVEDEFRRRYPENPILSVVTYVPVTQTEPGVFHHPPHAKVATVHLGAYPATSPPSHHDIARSFCDLLASTGTKTIFHEDIQIERWSKLLVNMENPICALSRLRDAQFFNSADGAADSLRRVMEEVASVARAAGYASIDNTVVSRSIDFLTVRHLPGVEPSTMADALAGRTMEVESLVGNVLRMAREFKVDTPRVELVYYLLNGLNASFKLNPKQAIAQSPALPSVEHSNGNQFVRLQS